MLLVLRFILFPRAMVPPVPDAERGLRGLTKLFVSSSQGPVEGWLLPGDGVSAARPGPAALFGHANGELIDHWPQVMEGYRRMGISVLLAEFRGYGRSAGSPSQQALTEDFEAFHDLLVNRPEVDPARVVLHGRSMGGGAVCALARRHPPAALILMSTFTSIRDLARRFLVPGFLVRDPFDNMSVVRDLLCPVLIFHGERDSLVPFSHAERLCAAARRGRLVAYPRAEHNDCPPDWPGFWEEVRRFLFAEGILR